VLGSLTRFARSASKIVMGTRSNRTTMEKPNLQVGGAGSPTWTRRRR
jgi:hypothetical protein